ncbi:GAF and ANTAR domain-containing protein [Actinoallomurus acaciae]|uniref:GAF and ANTAR domain-containing protein n=1 Tax=Actinoallomurus acaciae TaxID=502577 RepID=A0ABV5YEK4_9ACTN
MSHHLAGLARLLEAEDDAALVVQQILRLAENEVPGAVHAGATMLGQDGASTPVYTGELAARLDALQYDVGQGPCVDALLTESVCADDLAYESRWPRFAPLAVARGVRSVLAFRLSVRIGAVGVLSLYSPKPHAFTAAAERVGGSIAACAAIAMATIGERAQLRNALESRDVIGQAKGILMERYRVAAQEAFALLSASSQHTNVKLRDVAERLAKTGEFTPPPADRD